MTMIFRLLIRRGGLCSPLRIQNNYMNFCHSERSEESFCSVYESTYFCTPKTNSMKKAIFTIVFLILSNTFMTFAWYGHLKFKTMTGWENLPLVAVILIRWGLAFFD